MVFRRIALMALLVITTRAFGQQDESRLTIDDATFTAGVVNRQPVNRIRQETRAQQPLTLWLRVTGRETALEDLQREGKLPLRVRWYWHVLGRPVEEDARLIDEVDLSVGRDETIAELRQELFSVGFFDWRTWSEKSNLRRGYWVVTVVYADGTPVDCSRRISPCRFAIGVR